MSRTFWHAVLAIVLTLVAIERARAADVMPIWQNDTVANTMSFQDTFGHQVSIGSYNPTTGAWSASMGSVSIGATFTGGLLSVGGSPAANGGTLAFTVAGTSGGIPYFSGASTWASSAALSANQIVLGGGAGVAPSTSIGLGTTTQLLHGNASGAPTWGAISSADVSTVLASPPPIGSTAANTGAFTALTVTPASGLTQGYLSTQTLTGTAGGGLSANNIIISSDNVAASGVSVLGLSINHTFGGAATQGARAALGVFLAQSAITNATNPGNGRNYEAAEFSVYSVSGDGGTSGTPLGAYFAVNTNANGNNGAVNMLELTTEEADFGLNTGSSAQFLFGKALVETGTVHATLASSEEAYLAMYKAGAAVGLNNGIMFGITFSTSDYPVATTGSLINSLAGTVTYGINFLNVTCSTACWASPGASIDSVGNVVANSYNLVANEPIFWGTNTGTNGGQIVITTASGMVIDNRQGGDMLFRFGTSITEQFRILAAGGVSMAGTAGVTCPGGVTAGTVTVKGGIVTHC